MAEDIFCLSMIRLGITLRTPIGVSRTANIMMICACLRGPETHKSSWVRSLEILLVAESEAMARTLSATLRRAGHLVTASTTLAGTIETLMRRGPYVDVIMTSTRWGSSLGDDVVEYSRR